MEDLRDARNTVVEFAVLIDHLRPDANTSHRREQTDGPATKRQNSTGSSKSGKGSISSRWRSKTLKKDWDETTEGICKYNLGVDGILVSVLKHSVRC